MSVCEAKKLYTFELISPAAVALEQSIAKQSMLLSAFILAEFGVLSHTQF